MSVDNDILSALTLLLTHQNNTVNDLSSEDWRNMQQALDSMIGLVLLDRLQTPKKDNFGEKLIELLGKWESTEFYKVALEGANPSLIDTDPNPLNERCSVYKTGVAIHLSELKKALAPPPPTVTASAGIAPTAMPIYHFKAKRGALKLKPDGTLTGDMFQLGESVSGRYPLEGAKKPFGPVKDSRLQFYYIDPTQWEADVKP